MNEPRVFVIGHVAYSPDYGKNISGINIDDLNPRGINQHQTIGIGPQLGDGPYWKETNLPDYFGKYPWEYPNYPKMPRGFPFDPFDKSLPENQPKKSEPQKDKRIPDNVRIFTEEDTGIVFIEAKVPGYCANDFSIVQDDNGLHIMCTTPNPDEFYAPTNYTYPIKASETVHTVQLTDGVIVIEIHSNTDKIEKVFDIGFGMPTATKQKK